MSDFMADLSGLTSASPIAAKNSTSRKDNTELKMEDFLTLMIVQLQSQTMDNTADTSEMLNQMVSMQMVTALSNMTDASLMGYASSMVGKDVTVGVPKSNGKIEERLVTIIGSGVSGGKQVLFASDGETYELNQIMAVGRLPAIRADGSVAEVVDKTLKPGEGAGSTEKPDDNTDRTEDPTDPAEDEDPGEGGENEIDPSAPAEEI